MYNYNPYLSALNNYTGFNSNYMQSQLPNNKYEVIRVSGENGAKAFQMPPNSQIILLDDSAPLIWLKVTDGAGYPTIKPYSISPIEEKPKIELESLENRISKLEERLNNVNESNVANVKPKKSKPNDE